MCECVVRLFLRIVAIHSELVAENTADKSEAAEEGAAAKEPMESEIEFAERFYQKSKRFITVLAQAHGSYKELLFQAS